jgi:hypothetical protein
VARSYADVGFVDTEEIFSRQSSDGLIGSDLIYEHVHLTPPASYILAKALFLQIAAKLAPAQGQASSADAPSETECERMLALTAYDRSRIAQEMLRRLQMPPFTNQLNHSQQILRFTLQAQNAGENPNDTALQYQWAISHWPDDHMLHYRYGMFLYQYNRAAAAEQLALAQPWDGFPVFFPDGTQIR